MVLVTGGTGFLGGVLVRQLLQVPTSLRLLVRAMPASPLAGVEYCVGDVLDYDALIVATQGVEVVYHCAAVVSFEPKHHGLMLQTNVVGTRNVVNAALANGVARLVHVSSIAALSRSHTSLEPISEDNYWIDSSYNSVYGRSKYEAELEVWRGFAEGLQGAIVNPAIIMGKPSGSVGTHRFYDLAYQQFPVYSTGSSGWVGVDDVAKAMVALMHSPLNEVRFIISGGNHTYQHIANTIAKKMNKKPPYIQLKPWISALAWRLAWVASRLTGRSAFITHESARNATSQSEYNNQAFLRAFPDFVYEPIEAVLARGAAHYLTQLSKTNA